MYFLGSQPGFRAAWRVSQRQLLVPGSLSELDDVVDSAGESLRFRQTRAQGEGRATDAMRDSDLRYNCSMDGGGANCAGSTAPTQSCLPAVSPASHGP
jgi:hypothetical protein